MGNLNVETINNINVNNGFMQIYKMITGGDLCTQCDGKTGMFRIFNANASLPPNIIAGDNDHIINSYSIDSNFHKLICYNVRNNNVWERIKTSGVWRDWVSLQNEIQVDTKLDTKVDKVNGMGLSKNDFSDAYKTKVENIQNHFKGVFNSVAEINALINCIKGDYCILRGVPDLLYYHNGTNFINSGASLGGDMLSIVYDVANKKVDVYNRLNHTGKQAIDTITGLLDELNKKLNIADKTVVVDNFNSTSPTNALSANMGKVLQQNILSVISGQTKIDYGTSKTENGWTILGGGIILQWGFFDHGAKTSIREISFPIPFPNDCLNISSTVNGKNYSGSGDNSSYAQRIDRTKFSSTVDYATTSNSTSIMWFAIGY